MNEEQLLRFLEQVLLRGQEDKAKLVLDKMERVMTEQGQPEELTNLVRIAAQSIPEACRPEYAGQLTVTELRLAHDRAEARRRREEEARRNGRC